MKRMVGSILCVLAVLFIFGKVVGNGAETPAHNIQDYAVIGVLLAIGIPLSTAKKKEKQTDG